MSNKLTNENQVKAAIGITDWRHLSKEKLMDFVSVLPNVDSEVAIKIIDQFPEFSKNSIEMINIMKDLCTTALEEDTKSTNQSIEAYKQVLDDLSEMIKREDISSEDRKYFADKMIEVADKIGFKDTEGKDFKGKLLNTVGAVVVAAMTIGAGILGAKFIDSKNNKLL